ncbi:hypothetical protein [Microcoleus sp. B13-B6]|uniref:hypothetical protein n=1 Tax=Microcoleus sp. B13-B6 TaxID=2818652 RepID=UPI002FD73742
MPVPQENSILCGTGILPVLDNGATSELCRTTPVGCAISTVGLRCEPYAYMAERGFVA